MPNLEPVINGTIQPSDFVKNFVSKLPPEDYFSPQYDAPISIRPIRKPPFTATAFVASRRELFYFAVQKEDFFLSARHAIAAGIRERFIASIILFLFFFVLGIVYILTSPYQGVLSSLDDLSFASVSLTGPIVALFWYSRVIHNNHQYFHEIKLMRIRLSSASHAYETYEDVKRIRRQTQIQNEFNIEDEFVKVDKEIFKESRRNELEKDKLQERIQIIQGVNDTLRLDRFSEEAQLRIIELLLRYPEFEIDELEDTDGQEFPNASSS